MFSDDEIERAQSELADYRRNDALSNILDKYSTLIDDYKRLRSDYEEERDAREKYKQLAKGQERNPLVLVLVDGDGYVFHESLVEQGAEGGRIAAQRLDQAVKTSLRRKGLESCQVMVRIYANVAGLSKALYKAGVTGAEKRSLCPFIAGFNRSYGLAEFVDAGELKENADFKLRAMMHLYAENSQCKHIYFAACHDVGYISDLTPHMGNDRKFTLISSPGISFHDEFAKLGIGIEELPAVFRSTPLDSSTRARHQTSSWRTPPTPSPATTTVLLTNETNLQQKTFCRFYMLGKCRFGKDCNNIHPKEKAVKRRTTTTWGDDNDHVTDMNGNRFNINDLPDRDEIPQDQVAININSFRLDPYIPPASPKIINQLKSLITGGTRLCNNYQLNGSCENGSLCKYSHDRLDAEFRPALETLARAMPCPKRGACRNGACTQGHICQNLDCKHRGGAMYCKMPYAAHTEDLAVAKYVPAIPKAKQANLEERQVSPPPADDGYDDGDSVVTSSDTSSAAGDIGAPATYSPTWSQ